MTTTGADELDLVQRIRAMPEQSVADFITEQSRGQMLSETVRRLNRDVLSHDAQRSEAALAAIHKLGFL